MNGIEEVWVALTVLFSFLALAVFLEALVIKWLIGRRWSDRLVAALVANIAGLIAVVIAVGIAAGESASRLTPTTGVAIAFVVAAVTEWPVYAAFSKRGWIMMLGVSFIANLSSTAILVAPLAFIPGS